LAFGPLFNWKKTIINGSSSEEALRYLSFCYCAGRMASDANLDQFFFIMISCVFLHMTSTVRAERVASSWLATLSVLGRDGTKNDAASSSDL